MRRRHCFLVLFLYVFLSQTSAAPTATQVIKDGENKMRGQTSYSKLTISVQKRRFSRVMELAAYDDRKKDQFFIRILSPKKDRDTTFLKIKNNLWQYIPKIGKEIKIEASLMHDSWMGSDFTNDDLVKQSSIIDDYEHRFLPEEEDGFYKIELLPRPQSPVVWQKIIIYSRKSDHLPVKEEFYDHKNALKKIMTLSDFKPMGKRVIPVKIVMGSVENNVVVSKTTMIYSEITFDLPLSDFVFSKAHLRKIE